MIERGFRWVRGTVWVPLLMVLAMVLAGCGAAEQAMEPSGEEQDMLAATEKPMFGIGDTLPYIYDQSPGSPTDNIFEQFREVLHAGATRIILDAAAVIYASTPIGPGCPTTPQPDGGPCTAVGLACEYGSPLDGQICREVEGGPEWLPAINMTTALAWAKDARSKGLDPYVSVTAPKGYNKQQYGRDVGNIYKALEGEAVHFSAINEPDYLISAEDAADYWLEAALGLRHVCGKKCFVAAGEFATVDDETRECGETYEVVENGVKKKKTAQPYVKCYMARLRKHLANNRELPKPIFWSMHDYQDLQANSYEHAKAYAKILTNSEFSNAHIWINETGAVLKAGGNETSLAGNANRQEKAGSIFLNMARNVPGVSRILYYEIQGVASPTFGWDSGLIDWNGNQRPIACVLLDEPRAMCTGSLRAAGP
jgi:hypothetical protein